MVTPDKFRQLALSFPDAVEQPHFERRSFRVKKKIFATLDEQQNLACLKLSETDQDIFSLAAISAIYPVPNKWGKHGWTNVELEKVEEELVRDVLGKAYIFV